MGLAISPGVGLGIGAIILQSREIYAQFNNQSISSKSSNIISLHPTNQGGGIDNSIVQPQFMTKTPGGVHLHNIDFSLYADNGGLLVAPFNCTIVVGLNVTIHV